MASSLPNGEITAEDLYDLPDDSLHYEVVAGQLTSEPPPGFRHGLVIMSVAKAILNFLEDHPLGFLVGNDTGFILARSPDTVRGPDLAFVTKERAQNIGDPSKAFPGAPDLAVEVPSPSQRTGEVRAKVADYLVAGARLVWIVDPENARVTVYRSLLAPHVLNVDDILDGGDVLPGFEVQVGKLFEA